MSFWQTKTRRDKVDDLFSKFIRARDKWTCQRCGRKWPEGSAGLTCSHFFSRRMESVRFDPENCDAFCMFPCHDQWENEKGVTHGVHNGERVELAREYRLWKTYQLGNRRFETLEVRAHTTCKKDRKKALFYVKALMADLKKENPVIGARS